MQPIDSQGPLTPPAAPAAFQAHRRISSFAVRELCGGVSNMTLWRWLNEPTMNFPKPIKIGKRRYWRETEIIAWLGSREVAA